MILPNFKDFPVAGRIIGVDWGARRTGVAISDENREFVFVREPIVSKSEDDLINKLVELIVAERVSGVVMGLPLYMDGTESGTTNMVRAFANNLANRTDVPICFWMKLYHLHQPRNRWDGSGYVILNKS